MTPGTEPPIIVGEFDSTAARGPRGALARPKSSTLTVVSGATLRQYGGRFAASRTRGSGRTAAAVDAEVAREASGGEQRPGFPESVTWEALDGYDALAACRKAGKSIWETLPPTWMAAPERHSHEAPPGAGGIAPQALHACVLFTAVNAGSLPHVNDGVMITAVDLPVWTVRESYIGGAPDGQLVSVPVQDVDLAHHVGEATWSLARHRHGQPSGEPVTMSWK
jgi:hypothetical protein